LPLDGARNLQHDLAEGQVELEHFEMSAFTATFDFDTLQLSLSKL